MLWCSETCVTPRPPISRSRRWHTNRFIKILNSLQASGCGARWKEMVSERCETTRKSPPLLDAIQKGGCFQKPFFSVYIYKNDFKILKNKYKKIRWTAEHFNNSHAVFGSWLIKFFPSLVRTNWNYGIFSGETRPACLYRFESGFRFGHIILCSLRTCMYDNKIRSECVN